MRKTQRPPPHLDQHPDQLATMTDVIYEAAPLSGPPSLVTSSTFTHEASSSSTHYSSDEEAAYDSESSYGEDVDHAGWEDAAGGASNFSLDRMPPLIQAMQTLQNATTVYDSTSTHLHRLHRPCRPSTDRYRGRQCQNRPSLLLLRPSWAFTSPK